MAQTAVEIVVKVLGGQQLKQLDNSLKGTAANAVKASAGLDKTARSAKKAGQEAGRAKSKIDQLAGAAGRLAKAYVAIQLGRFIINSTAQFERLEKQLTTVTGSAETARKVFRQLDQINLESPFELTQLTQAAAKLSAFGVENDKLVDTTRRLGLVAAATQQEISGIALAYGQVKAKGRLQGEELLQFVERGVPLQAELQRMLGLTGKEFQDAMRKGQIGSELVEKAVVNLTDETGQFGKAFDNTSGTIDNKLSNMRDQFAKTAAALGKSFAPVFKYLIEGITRVAGYFENVFKRISRGQKGLAAERAAEQKATQFTRDRFGAVRSAAAPFAGDQEVLDFREKAKNSALQNELARVDRELAELRGEVGSKPTLPKAPTAEELAANRNLLLGNNDKGNGTGGGTKLGSGSAAADEAERKAKAIADGLRSSEESLAVMKQEVKVSEAASELMRQQEALELSRLQINQDYDTRMREALENELSEQQKINIELERGLALRKASVDSQGQMMDSAQGEFTDFFQQQPEYAKMFNDELTNTEQLLNGAYNTITNGLQSGIEGLIKGTKDWGDVLGDIASQLGSMLLNFGFQMLGAGIGIPGMSVPGFADGGTLPRNGPAIVGENGPELVMSQGGQTRVYSNEQSRDAMSMYSPSNQEMAPQAMPSTFKLETVTINNIEYATVAQVQQMGRSASAEGAKVGEQRAMNRLRQSRSTRSKIGL